MLTALTTFNPFYWILRWVMMGHAFNRVESAIQECRAQLKNIQGKDDESNATKKELGDAILEFESARPALVENIVKQSMVLLFSLASVVIVHYFMPDPQQSLGAFLEKYEGVTTGLVTGWFVITFASVKRIFLRDATFITFFMFSAFSIIWALIGLNVFYTNPNPLAGIGLLVIVFAWTASAMYDNMDCLRTGLDEAALRFYQSPQRGGLGVKIVNN